MERWTIRTLLETATGYLRDKGSPSARLDAELLLAETLGLERIHLYTEYDRPLTACEVDGYRALIARRAVHEPVAYILGRAHFRRLALKVGPAVLIPRPETEELVDVALGLLLRRPPLRAGKTAAAAGAMTRTGAVGPAGLPNGEPLIADVGTGSGAIALSLAQEAAVAVTAIDDSAEALVVASRNAAALGLESLVDLQQADLLTGIPGDTLHLVISNPPYVASGDLDSLAPDVREFEPLSALDAGPDGLAVIRRLLPEAARVLRPGGSLLLEVGDGQAFAVQGLAREAGFAVTAAHKDLSGKDRIVEATKAGAVTLSLAGAVETDLAAIGVALEAGAIIGIPTDTVYGLAARWDSARGVRRLFAAKGRSPEQPVAALFPSVESVVRALPDLEPAAGKILAALLPGPFTFIVSTGVSRPAMVGTEDSLGVRVPDHPGLLGLMCALGSPLAATSANRTCEKDPADVTEVDAFLAGHCSAVFAAPEGERATGSASTVVDLRPLSGGGSPVVLREGAVSGPAVLERIAAL